ncbi:hypothetical protein MCC93_21390 [Morococcus cerebrosus]|uniref:Uncharacterized protein n=1 Tax=Morococcus cerebrosus TaxID=1056807 RepID=A0A0C1GX26_9NEIS|nr:hypothetical protein MCC93_21390 [Morococcus cerebrosus]
MTVWQVSDDLRLGMAKVCRFDAGGARAVSAKMQSCLCKQYSLWLRNHFLLSRNLLFAEGGKLSVIIL